MSRYLHSRSGVLLQCSPRIGDPCEATEGDALDALFVLQYHAGIFPFLPCLDGADVNRDDATDAVDGLLILQFDAGLIHCLPP